MLFSDVQKNIHPLNPLKEGPQKPHLRTVLWGLLQAGSALGAEGAALTSQCETLDLPGGGEEAEEGRGGV